MEKAWSIIIMVMLLVVTLQGFSVSNAQSPSDDKILVSITKNSVVYLSSQDQMVRAHVEITDYSPFDGDLFMKIVKESSGEVVSESKINVRQNSGNIWSTEIGYMVDNQNPNDSDSLIGTYEIQISPENGAYQGSASFQVLLKPIQGPKIQSITAADPTKSASYSNGDTITVVFSEPTNQPKVETKPDLDKLFSFSQNLGADYAGSWTDPSTLVITIVDSSGATPPTIGGFRATLKESGDLTNAEGTSLVSTTTSPTLVGIFGTAKETGTNLNPPGHLSQTPTSNVSTSPHTEPIVLPGYNGTITTDKQFYIFGDIIKISGKIQPVPRTPFSITITAYGERSIYYSWINVNSDGTFLINIPTSDNDNWKLYGGVYKFYINNLGGDNDHAYQISFIMNSDTDSILDPCYFAPPNEAYACGQAQMYSKLQYLQERGYDPMAENLEMVNEKARNERYQQQVNMITWSLILIPIIGAVVAGGIWMNRRKNNSKKTSITVYEKEKNGISDSSKQDIEDEWMGA